MMYPKPRSQETLNLIKRVFVYVDDGRHPIRFENGTLPNYRVNADGYVSIRFPNGEGNIMVSHIVWFLNTGRWPTLQLDHKDDNKKNNKFENLQELTHADNNGRRASNVLEKLT